MNFRVSPRLSRSFKWLISAVILYVIFTKLPFSAVGAVIVTADPGWILLAYLCGFIARYFSAVRMKLITDRQGLTHSTWQIYKINLMTNFYGMFLPGYLAGGAIRWYKLASPDNKPSETLIAIIFNRWLQTVGVIVIGLIFWSLDSRAHTNGWTGVVLTGILAVFLVLYLLVFNRTIATSVLRVVTRRRFLPAKLRDRLQELFNAAGHYDGLPKPVVARFWMLTFVGELIGVGSFMCFVLSLDLGLAPANIGWVRSYTLLISMIPISFSGLGVREGTLIYLLGTYAVPATAAVALSFLLFSRMVLAGACGGILEAVRHFMPAKSLSAEKTSS